MFVILFIQPFRTWNTNQSRGIIVLRKLYSQNLHLLESHAIPMSMPDYTTRITCYHYASHHSSYVSRVDIKNIRLQG
jgi:hypothetical protein